MTHVLPVSSFSPAGASRGRRLKFRPWPRLCPQRAALRWLFRLGGGVGLAMAIAIQGAGAEDVVTLKNRIAAGETKAKVARDLGLSRETLYQYLRQP